MKKTIILIIFLFSEIIFSQAGGLSASKLTALSPTTVPKNKMEFEPAFGFGFSTDFWNENGALVPIGGNPDTLLSAASFFFRFTYGIADNWEIGISVPAEMSYLSIAGKGEVFVVDKFSAAVLFGVNAPLGNGGYRIYNKGINHFEYNAAIVGRGVFSYEFTKNLSLDTDVQLQRHLGVSDDGEVNRTDFFIDSDLGYYFVPGLQAIAGLYYSKYGMNDKSKNGYRLTVNIGITIERAKHFILVLNTPFDLAGKSTQRIYGAGLALTILLD